MKHINLKQREKNHIDSHINILYFKKQVIYSKTLKTYPVSLCQKNSVVG